MGTEANKQLVRRLFEQVIPEHDLTGLREIAEERFAARAEQWVAPFRGAFADFAMRIVALIAEGDTVVAHLKCSGTHTGEWLGAPATGRRFEDVDEIYVFRVRNGRLSAAFGVEDNLTRMRQLGIGPA